MIGTKAVSRALMALALVAAPGSAALADSSFALNYGSGQTTALPSQTGQGLSYDTAGGGGVAESSVMSVSNNALVVNTAQYGTDYQAGYVFSGGYDHTLDAQLSIDLKVDTVTGSTGFYAGFYDSHNSDILFIKSTSWSLYGTGAGGTITAGAYHQFTLTTSAATNTYELQVDGATVATGTNDSGIGGDPQMFFGDGTPTGGNLTAEIASISYTNGTLSVPEPATAWMTAVGLLLAPAVVRRFAGRDWLIGGRRAGR